MKFRIILLSVILFSSNMAESAYLRSMVVWNTATLLGDSIERNIFFNQCIADSTTDIFLYSYDLLTGAYKTKMQNFVAKARCNKINVWAMDGFRGYFYDWYGRADYMNFIHSVITYNNGSPSNQRFIGIQGDNEPHDGQGEPSSSFHNDIPGSLLDTSAGGVWQTSEALDREYLMRDWISMTREAYDSCHLYGLRYGQLMVNWLDDYYGEPVYCTYNGQYKRVLEHIMNYLDDYVTMSYSTKPGKTFNLIKAELDYADSLPVNIRPRIWVSFETHCGVGAKISYCDTLLKNKKDSVYNDLAFIEPLCSVYSSFIGFNMHDWEGWKVLSPASSDSSDPGCFTPISSGNIQKNEVIQIYPNPVKGQVYISNVDQPTSVEIMDMMGVIQYREKINKQTHTLNFTGRPGIYLVKFQTEHNIQVGKIIIE